MSEQVGQQRELRPPRRHRFTAAAIAVDLFRHAPRGNLRHLRQDLDDGVDQDITPRS